MKNICVQYKMFPSAACIKRWKKMYFIYIYKCTQSWAQRVIFIFIYIGREGGGGQVYEASPARFFSQNPNGDSNGDITNGNATAVVQ